MKFLYNSKHLTYDDGLKIQQGISNRNNKSSIATSIFKSHSTINKELKNYRKRAILANLQIELITTILSLLKKIKMLLQLKWILYTTIKLGLIFRRLYFKIRG